MTGNSVPGADAPQGQGKKAATIVGTSRAHGRPRVPSQRCVTNRGQAWGRSGL